MLLKDVINDLVQIELVNLAIGKPEWSTGKFSYTTLINCISLAYVELHKRFALKKEIITLQPIKDLHEYPLTVAHAVSDGTTGVPKYIIDSVTTPFSNNISKIDSIYDYLGQTVVFNTTDFNDLVKTLDYRTLYLKEPDPDHTISVVCRALPKSIVLSSEAALDTYDLDLPVTYLEALLCYAAGRAYSNRGAENATNNESSIFFARFERACMNIEQLGLYDKESLQHDRLSGRGFV